MPVLKWFALVWCQLLPLATERPASSLRPGYSLFRWLNRFVYFFNENYDKLSWSTALMHYHIIIQWIKYIRQCCWLIKMRAIKVCWWWNFILIFVDESNTGCVKCICANVSNDHLECFVVWGKAQTIPYNLGRVCCGKVAKTSTELPIIPYHWLLKHTWTNMKIPLC